MKKRHKNKRLPRNSLNETRLTDTKLSRIAIHYEYLFEWGVNFKSRTITLTDEIDSFEFERIDAALTEMEEESKAGITIKINSPGGYVYDALAIVGRINESKCQITTKGYGCVMSAATMILASGDKRKISSTSWFMHHEPSVNTGEMRASELEDASKQLQREEKQWAKFMAEYTNKTEKFWLDKGSRVDTYFNADELVKLGVADEVF